MYGYLALVGAGMLSLTLSSCELLSRFDSDYDQAAEWSADRGGHALLVYEKGDLVYEAYDNGWDKEEAHRLAAGTTVFTCTLAAAAAEDGLLRLNELAANTLTEWKGSESRPEITLGQLLSLTSGLDVGDYGTIPSYASAIEAESLTSPGARFDNGPVPFQVFGEILRRKLEPTGESLPDYLERRILDPIGLTVDHWLEDEDGNRELASGAYLTARAWGRLGLLLEQQGMWHSSEVINAQWLEPCTQGSEVANDYGLGLWLVDGSDEFDKQIPDDTYYAAGAGGQRLYIIPSKNLVVVRFGETSSWNDNRFLLILLGEEEP